MNNDRENDSLRTSTDIYGGMDTDYNTQYIPFDAEEDFESGGGDAEFGNAPEPKKKRKKKHTKSSITMNEKSYKITKNTNTLLANISSLLSQNIPISSR